ncbi:MAG: hypothetical protein ACRDH9_05655 [Actinomycetota bacterium]
MSEELDWGPQRPPAVGWAGALLILVALAQLGFIGVALVLDLDALIATDADRLVMASVGGLLALQVLAGIAVLRLWRWWRGIAVFLCVLGVALHGANLAGPPDRPVVVGINVGLAGAYLIVMLLLFRSRGT